MNELALPTPFRIASLCAGIGGIDLGIRIAVPGAHGVVYVEREAYAAAVLVARMEDETLAPAPIWDHLETFDARAWRGVVDCITAGFPCTPFSVAGKRAGLDDDRWLWPEVARCIREMGPRFVFLENSPELVRDGLAVIAADLSALGYRFAWDVVSAAEVGASQLRERVWLLADADRGGFRFEQESGSERVVPAVVADDRAPLGSADRSGRGQSKQSLRPRVNQSDFDRSDPIVGGTDGDGRSLQRRQSGQSEVGHDPDRSGGAPAVAVGLADGDRIGRETSGQSRRARSQSGPDPELGRFPLFPPFDGDHDGWRELLAGSPHLEPAIRRNAHGAAVGVDGRPVTAWNDRIRVIGNGVVPLAAAVAFLRLRDRLNGAAS